MSSAEAADWLIEHFPLDGDRNGDAFVLMQHRSWKAADQFRLAQHYLRNAPYGDPNAYKSLLSFMPAKRFLLVLGELVSPDHERRDLLEYHLAGLLKGKVLDGQESPQQRRTSILDLAGEMDFDRDFDPKASWDRSL